MGYTIVSGNKPSSEHYIKILQYYLSKCFNQMPNIVLILNMPKTKWVGAEDPPINNFFKIDSRNCFKSADRPKPKRVQVLKLDFTEIQMPCIRRLTLKNSKIENYFRFLKLRVLVKHSKY